MTRLPLWVALEGPCCAGKTTLGRNLVRRLRDSGATYVECYADHVGGGRFLPRAVPDSPQEDEQALQRLLIIESGRTAHARSRQTAVAVLDRSVHTLLAHRYALQSVTGLACYAPARQALAQSTIPTWPDLVLYLDVPHRTVHDRNNGKFPHDSILINADFNAAIRTYFMQLARQGKPHVAWLEATQDTLILLDTVEALIGELLKSDMAEEVNT